jgi:hypothetical protein
VREGMNQTKEKSVMFSKMDVLSIILSAGLMFGLSYSWHSIVLNDFLRAGFMSHYYILAPLSYLALSFSMFLIISLRSIKILFRNYLVRGFFTGALCGLVVYLILFVFGLTFGKNTNLLNAIVNLLWQVIEQGAGGVLIKVLYVKSRTEKTSHLNYSS